MIPKNNMSKVDEIVDIIENDNLIPSDCKKNVNLFVISVVITLMSHNIGAYYNDYTFLLNNIFTLLTK